MKNLRTVLMMTLAAGLQMQTATASPASDAMSACFVNHSSEQDRLHLLMWIGTAMAAHPSVAPVLSSNPDQLIQIDRDMAALFARLMIDDCNAEIKAAIAVDGMVVFQQTGEILGRIAMQDMMTNPAVNARIESFTAQLDADAIDAAFD